MLFNKTRQYNIQIYYKIIFFKYRTRQIKKLLTLIEMIAWLKWPKTSKTASLLKIIFLTLFVSKEHAIVRMLNCFYNATFY